MGIQMGGKKKGGKAKKKGGGGEFGLKVEEQNMVYEAMRDALASKYVKEKQEADHEKREENEMRLRELAIERQLANQEKIQMDIISDMTRQFKSVESDLTNHINRLENRKTDNLQQIKNLEDRKEALVAEIKDSKEKKETMIKQLMRRIDELSNDFAKMLGETLDNMRAKINEANTKW